MSENPPIPALAQPNPDSAELGPTGETFIAVTVRRLRYVASIVVTAALLLMLAWPLVGPPPTESGISLTAWGRSSDLLGAAALAGLLVLGVFLSMLICHPDSPHIGIFCTFLGLGALAIRGGNMHQMVYNGQVNGDLTHTYKLLAIECVHWGVLIMMCEVATRLFYDRIFANIHWMHRGSSEKELARKVGSVPHPSVEGVAMSLWLLALTRKTGDKKPNRILQNALGLLTTAFVAALLLQALMQSEAKGQVLFALYLSFAVAAGCGRGAAPHCEPWALMLAVPLAAAVGYLTASTKMLFPGETVSAMARALPIDYLCAGVPATILGYYFAFRIQFQHAMEQD